MQCDADADVCNRKSPFSTTKIHMSEAPLYERQRFRWSWHSESQRLLPGASGHVTNVRSLTCGAFEQCDAEADVCNRKSPFSTTKIESFFPVGVEDMQVRYSFSVEEHLPRGNMKRFRGGLVFKAHRLLYHSTLGFRVKTKRKTCRFVRVIDSGLVGSTVGGLPRAGDAPGTSTQSHISPSILVYDENVCFF